MRSRNATGRVGIAALTALALALAPGCKDDDGGTADARATVTGRLVGTAGEAIAGAAVLCGTEPEGTTDAAGAFTLRLAAGAHRLAFVKAGQVLAGRCLAVAEHTVYELGDLSATTPSLCEQGPFSSDDADGDGLADADEVAGWAVVVVKGDGSIEMAVFASDPNVADGDADGLSDAEEYAARTNPVRVDTDGDLLGDLAELTVFKSDPTSMDTDGDSRGPDGTARTDPNLWDGNELLRSRTSPTLADTDGDGLTDWEEIHSGGTSPLVADLPTLALELYGDPLISVQADIQAGCTAVQVQLERDTTENVETDLVSTKMSIENTVKLHTEAEVGTSQWPPSASAKLTTDTEFKHAFSHDTSSSWTQSSVEESQSRTECFETKNASYAGGTVETAMKLRNRSDLTFKVKDLRVIAYQLRGGGRFSVVGTLVPVDWNPDGHVLGPAGELVFDLKQVDLAAETTQALVRNPSALFFEIGGYSLFQLDEWGVTETVNYAKLGESVVQRTGLVAIDAGGGAVERRMVATNVYRHPDGTSRGVTLREALETLGIAYETEVQKDGDGNVVGPAILTKVRDVAAYPEGTDRPGRGFWLVAGTGPSFEPGAAVDFDDVVLEDGGRVSLVYMADTDLDGIFDREEALLGTDETRPDTDDDGLDDYEETKVGWGVSAAGRSYQVFSDPRFLDYDGDYLSDATERGARTDPYRRDTDGDGVHDTNDPDPCNPPCLYGEDLGLAAWWGIGATPTDFWTWASPGAVGYASNLTAMNGALVRPVAGGYVLDVNPSAAVTNQYFETADHASLSPTREVSLSAWVFRNDLTTFPTLSTILAKGPYDAEHYALYLDATGKAAFVMRRRVHEKCWYCWFGSACDDGSCADTSYNQRNVLWSPGAVVTPGEWVLLTATFGGEYMRLYVNGVQVAAYDTSVYWADGWYRYETTTSYLLTTTSPLRIGASAASTWQFSGMLDDVQVYGAGLAAGQVLLHEQLGVCESLPPRL